MEACPYMVIHLLVSSGKQNYNLIIVITGNFAMTRRML